MIATVTGQLPNCACGAKLHIATVAEPPPGHTPHALIHAEPTCQRFDQMAPDAFISWLLGWLQDKVPRA